MWHSWLVVGTIARGTVLSHFEYLLSVALFFLCTCIFFLSHSCGTLLFRPGFCVYPCSQKSSGAVRLGSSSEQRLTLCSSVWRNVFFNTRIKLVATGKLAICTKRWKFVFLLLETRPDVTAVFLDPVFAVWGFLRNCRPHHQVEPSVLSFGSRFPLWTRQRKVGFVERGDIWRLWAVRGERVCWWFRALWHRRFLKAVHTAVPLMPALYLAREFAFSYASVGTPLKHRRGKG